VADIHSERWHEDRRRGIGGSDWQHIFNIPPWGCARKLFFEKERVESDYQFRPTGEMMRGTMLEPLLLDLFYAQSPELVRFYPPFINVKEALLPDWWAFNLDSLAGRGPELGKLVVEAKTVGRNQMERLMRGHPISQGWKYQGNHYMMPVGAKHCTFPTLHADSWTYREFEIELDMDLYDQMVEAGDGFMEMRMDGVLPDAHAKPIEACHTCPWRSTCRGQELREQAGSKGDQDICEVEDTELELAVVDYMEIQSELKRLEEAKEEAREELLERLKGRSACDLPRSGFRVYHRKQSRGRIDLKRLRADLPKVAEEYTTISQSQTLRIFPI